MVCSQVKDLFEYSNVLRNRYGLYHILTIDFFVVALKAFILSCLVICLASACGSSEASYHAPSTDVENTIKANITRNCDNTLALCIFERTRRDVLSMSLSTPYLHTLCTEDTYYGSEFLINYKKNRMKIIYVCRPYSYKNGSTDKFVQFIDQFELPDFHEIYDDKWHAASPSDMKIITDFDGIKRSKNGFEVFFERDPKSWELYDQLHVSISNSNDSFDLNKRGRTYLKGTKYKIKIFHEGHLCMESSFESLSDHPVPTNKRDAPDIRYDGIPGIQFDKYCRLIALTTGHYVQILYSEPNVKVRFFNIELISKSIPIPLD